MRSDTKGLDQLLPVTAKLAVAEVIRDDPDDVWSIRRIRNEDGQTQNC